MLGAIAGDIAGSPWEGGQCPAKEFTLFGGDCVFTDDSVCSIAVAQALLDEVPFDDALRSWVKRYPSRGYGGGFIDWASDPERGPYDSFGNGGAMRVAAVGWLARSVGECLSMAEASATVTHSHAEGVEGAKAIALAVWMARQGATPAKIRRELSWHTSYDLSATIDELRAGMEASTRAIDSVPIALVCAMESGSWRDAVRNVASVGGDCDTTACMAGAVAEARFGLPGEVARAALTYLPPEMVGVVARVYAKAGHPLPWLAKPSLRARVFGWILG